MSHQLDLGAAEHLTITTSTGPIAALATGSPEAPPVLLVPGYTGSKEDFGPILDGIAAAGYRAVAIDLPGQFESPGPDDPAQYTPDVLGAVVAGVARSLGRSVQLLGHSFGGLVARAAVISAQSQFTSLVLMDSGPAALGGQRAALIAHLEPMLVESGIAAVYEATEAIYQQFPDYEEPAPELGAFLRKRFLGGNPAMLQGMGHALRGEPDRVDELAAAQLPTLVLYGVDDDAWMPDVQDEMAGRLGAAVSRIPAAAHSPAVENPMPTLEALLAFWGSVPQTGPRV